VSSRPRRQISVVMSAAAESISVHEPRGPTPPPSSPAAHSPRSQLSLIVQRDCLAHLLGGSGISGLVGRRGSRRARGQRSRLLVGACSAERRFLRSSMADCKSRRLGPPSLRSMPCGPPVLVASQPRRPSNVPRPELAGRTRRHFHE
jgi:hypothetical protein